MKKLILLSAASFLFILSSCLNKRGDIKGPVYYAANDQLSVMNFSPALANVNFSTGQTQYFTAQFNQKVSWKITLKGSNATKTIEGVSDFLDATNSSWDGSHDGIAFFRNETVTAKLTFLATSYSAETSFNITGTKNYGLQGALLSNFDGNGLATNWYTFSPDAPSELVYNGTENLSMTQSIPYLQGNNVITIEGKDGTGPTPFYITGYGCDWASTLNPDPSALYFNIYVYGYGGDYSNTQFTINIAQDNDGTPGHNPLTDDIVVSDIKVNWTGWKLVSFKYTDTPFSTVAGNGNNGPKIYNPDKIAKIGFVLISSPAGNKAKVSFDYPIFTYNQPFQP